MTDILPPNVTVDQFRIEFQSFKDRDKYTDAAINEYLVLALTVLNAPRFGAYLPLAQKLFAAHFLVLDKLDEQAAERGAIPGQGMGIPSSKSVGGVSVSYDVSASAEEGGGHWNATSFGRRLLRFARMVGAGGIQISGPSPQPGNWFPGSASIYPYGYS